MGFFTKIQNMGMAALIMGASIVLSRFMGLLRDKVISWQFGASGEADLYFAAFVVPDFINYLLAGGYVSITLMPILSQRFIEDSNDAWRFFSAVFWWALLAVSLLTAIAWLAAEPLAHMVAPGFSDAQSLRLAYFLRIILPAQIFFLSGACFSALLFLRKQFFVPALTPLIYNGCIIICGVAAPWLGIATGMEGFCYGVSLGAALGAWLLPCLAALRGGMYIRILWRHPLMWRFLLIALPLMLGQSVVMLNEQFLRIFGSFVGDGAVSLLSYARRISQVPVGMVGQAMAVASYPFLAALAVKKDQNTFNSTLYTAFSSSTTILLPFSAWMIAIATPTMGLIFEGGDFSTTDTLAAAPLLQIMLLAVPLWSIQMLLGRGFYAKGDTLTPAIVGTIVTLVSLPFFYKAPYWNIWTQSQYFANGAANIAFISVLGVALYVAILMYIWQKRYGNAAFTGLWALCRTSSILCFIAGSIAYSVVITITPLTKALPTAWPSIIAHLLTLSAASLAFILVYLLLAWHWAPQLFTALKKRVLRSRPH